jgi:hypothetical protein
MSDADALVKLAEQYAGLAKQMADVRRRMLAHLANGSDPAPGPTPRPTRG